MEELMYLLLGSVIIRIIFFVIVFIACIIIYSMNSKINKLEDYLAKLQRDMDQLSYRSLIIKKAIINENQNIENINSNNK